jgi:hypothetical protein
LPVACGVISDGVGALPSELRGSSKSIHRLPRSIPNGAYAERALCSAKESGLSDLLTFAEQPCLSGHNSEIGYAYSIRFECIAQEVGHGGFRCSTEHIHSQCVVPETLKIVLAHIADNPVFMNDVRGSIMRARTQAR